MMRLPSLPIRSVLVVGFAFCHPALAASPPASAPASLHDRFVASYMQGQWENLQGDLAANLKEIAAMPAPQKADIDYIRQALNECRPQWWKLCKAGQKVRFRPTVFKTTAGATFDPAATAPITVNYVGSTGSVVVKWTAANMDSAAVGGEVPFTKGEQNEVEVWTNLGTGISWTEIPPRSQINVSEAARQGKTDYIDFRGNVAGAYYVSPRARRWAIRLALLGWTHEFDKSPLVMSRKTIGILFAAEVVAHPEVYRSIPRPPEPPADDAESKVAAALQDWILHNDLTFAEDKAFRDVLRTFALKNDLKVMATFKVSLPNGQSMSLDPSADKPLAAQRDAWMKAQYAKRK